jgi:hypothetical protein
MILDRHIHSSRYPQHFNRDVMLANLSLPKTSRMTECDSCVSGRRDVRVPN